MPSFLESLLIPSSTGLVGLGIRKINPLLSLLLLNNKRLSFIVAASKNLCSLQPTKTLTGRLTLGPKAFAFKTKVKSFGSLSKNYL